MIVRLPYLIFTLLMLVMASCASDTPVMPADYDDDTAVRVTFTLSIGQISSRAASWVDSDLSSSWDDVYDSDDATTYESLISTLQVAVYEPGGERIGSLVDVTRLDGQRYSGRLSNLNGHYITTKALLGRTVRFHFIANSPVDYTSTSCNMPTEADLLEARYNPWYTDSYEYANDYIPMWGTTCIEMPEAVSDSDTEPIADIGTVYLLRAAAKVEIIIDEEYYEIEAIQLQGASSATYCDIPQYYDGSSKAVLSTGITDTRQLQRAYTTLWDTSPTMIDWTTVDKSFLPLAGEPHHAIFYIPEQENTDDSNLSIILTLSGETFDQCPLEFREYDSDGQPTGERYPILRNHNYRFVVNVLLNKIIVIPSDWDTIYNNSFTFQ